MALGSLMFSGVNPSSAHKYTETADSSTSCSQLLIILIKVNHYCQTSGNGNESSKGEGAIKIVHFSEQRNKLVHLRENTFHFCFVESLK